MADKTVTAANVLPSATAVLRQLKAQEAIAIGETVYYANTVGVAYPDARLADAGHATYYAVAGIAVSSAAAAGQYVIVVTQDNDFAPGFAATAGELLIQSDTPGKIAPAADLLTGMRPGIVGFGKANGKLEISFAGNSYGTAAVP